MYQLALQSVRGDITTCEDRLFAILLGRLESLRASATSFVPARRD
jgi:hypothetical protein